MMTWNMPPKNAKCCKGLYVVINAHHQSWLKDHYDGSQHFNQLFWSLWHDIALHFQSRDGHLIFEILNKPAQAGWVTVCKPIGKVSQLELAGFLHSIGRVCSLFEKT